MLQGGNVAVVKHHNRQTLGEHTMRVKMSHDHFEGGRAESRQLDRELGQLAVETGEQLVRTHVSLVRGIKKAS
jgi:hypothetical protein